MRCKKYAELISAFVDGELGRGEKDVLEAHLSVCPACARRLRFFTASKRVAAFSAVPEMPSELTAALLQEASKRRSRKSFWNRLFGSWEFPGLRPLVFGPAFFGSAAAALAAAVLIFVWNRGRSESVPLDWMLAAHSEYELTMPLSQASEIVPNLTARLSSLEEL
jgi:anti-sigma factor RsiW